MLSKDNSKELVQGAARDAKRSIMLQSENQKQNESGHSSAPYGSGPNASAAAPGNNPGKDKSSY